MIHFTLDIEPKAKARPRVTKTGKAYTPKVTKDFERSIKLLSRMHISEPLNGALMLEVLFVHPRLKSEPKKYPERKYKVTRPDLSNLLKSLEDGLEGIAFRDDAQIVKIEAEKVYASLNESAHIEVTLREIVQIGHPNTGAERRTRTGEENPTNPTDLTVGGETGERIRDDEMFGLSRKERTVINRRRHRKEQAEKHERMSKERVIRKLEQAQASARRVEDKRAKEARLKQEEENRKALEVRKLWEDKWKQAQANRKARRWGDDDD